MRSELGSVYCQSPARPFLVTLFGLKQALLLYHTLSLRLFVDGDHFARPSLDQVPVGILIKHVTPFLDTKHIASRLLPLNSRLLRIEK
jgi:hypothetical protein